MTALAYGALTWALGVVGFVILMSILMTVMSVVLLLFDPFMGAQGLAVSLLVFFGGRQLLNLIERRLDAVNAQSDRDPR